MFIVMYITTMDDVLLRHFDDYDAAEEWAEMLSVNPQALGKATKACTKWTPCHPDCSAVSLRIIQLVEDGTFKPVNSIGFF